MCAWVQSCPTLDPMDYSLPGSSVHGVFQARILEWVVVPFSRGSFLSRDQPVSPAFPALAGRFFSHWAIREAPLYSTKRLIPVQWVWPPTLFSSQLNVETGRLLTHYFLIQMTLSLQFKIDLFSSLLDELIQEIHNLSELFFFFLPALLVGKSYI